MVSTILEIIDNLAVEESIHTDVLNTYRIIAQKAAQLLILLSLDVNLYHVHSFIVVTWQVADISHYPPRKMFSIVKSAKERLQLSVDDFRKLTWLEWLSLLHSNLAESELGCVQLHTCHFIG